MQRRFRGVLLAVTFASTSVCGWPVLADRPNFVKQLFQKRESSEAELELQDKHGPWLILAATFSGEEARSSAVAYAKELRDRLKVPAFIMEQTSGEERSVVTGERIRTDELGRLVPKQLSARFANNFPGHAVAVLVGEFHSKDDPQIDSLLQKVKGFVPKTKIPGFDEREKINFLTRNPLLPEDFFQAPRIDRFVEELNRQEWIKHSVLDCPGRFTVRVATFRGSEVVTVAAKTNAKSEDPTDALDRAASKAHKMTVSLRGRGVEAYEFHDRYGSYVMIGSFDSLGRESGNGQFQYDPRITAILQEYCGYREVTAKDPSTGAVSRTMTLKSEARIPFDVEGKATAVPRPETSRIYSGSLFK
jgi:hypothetical protein